MKKEIIQNPEKPIADGILAESIVAISSSMNKLLKSGLNRRAIVALIHDDCKWSKRTISEVIDSIANLENNFTTKDKT